MTALNIRDEDLAYLRGSVVVLTGGSSGIGLATIELLIALGASVVSGDLSPSPVQHPRLSFHKTDVTAWHDLQALFAHAKQLHGRIHHVFANAGISGRMNYLEDRFDGSGSLLEPEHLTLDINLRAMINTCYLGLHYLRHQQPAGGSIVVTASGSSFQRFRVVDYATAKHGVLGFIRGLVPNLEKAGLPIRINGIAPSWTRTGLVPAGLLEAIGAQSQSAEVVARSVALLMADARRQGQLIWSDRGNYLEIEQPMLSFVVDILGGHEETADGIMDKIEAVIPNLGSRKTEGGVHQ
ncbi:hypothetical protein BAUCODRAFT_437377 [Baudoinia panamericana UAMH 10762]|uniref:Short-chain dehydrogenase/reductase SDR n=1 Tax=Baudoinia panamericana (strain UAMH 10762) TaxID=717646 RepID=M2LRK4_BAUPA|nr:uncharacterized protein BAUCODRAFT_437377 [Baudoinia panamericana UAMH 10762]EMC97077.1 hypothetical protein BAUCODRAFT_437377 [Baudoinia panamericana UAMH 10762]